jgi:transaldolase
VGSARGGVLLEKTPAAARIPKKGQSASLEVRERFDEPVPGVALAELGAKVPDFRRAYEPDGLSVEEFDDFGATRRTLRGFIASYHPDR